MQAPMAADIVFVEGLETEALVGAYDWERHARQPLLFDLDLEVDNRAAAAEDDLDDAVDYASVCAAVKRFVEASHYVLLETLAEALAAQLLRQFDCARAVRVRVRKPRAAHALGCDSVGVTIRRERIS